MFILSPIEDEAMVPKPLLLTPPPRVLLRFVSVSEMPEAETLKEVQPQAIACLNDGNEQLSQ